MGINWPSKTTGQKLNAADWNNARSDLVTGKFFDNAGVGSNYLQAAHNGTDSVLSNNTGHLKVNAPSGKEVKLQVNGADLLQAAASLLTLSAALKVADGSAGTPGVHFTGDTDTGLALLSSKLALVFGGSAVADFNASTGDFKALNLTTSGGIATSGSGVLTGAGGVKHKASGTGSDTLAHYEGAGSFTPSISYTGGGHSITYSAQNGRYERIGSLVRAEGLIGWSAYTEGTGSIAIQGLPYAVAGSGPGSLVQVECRGVTMPASTAWAVGRIGGGTEFNIDSVVDAASEVQWTAANTAFAASGALWFCAVYRT